MNRLEALRHNSGRVRSRMGGAFIGRRAVFRGHDLHADLTDIDWVELYTFGITGRRFNPNELKLLHAIWVYTSYPDARIWNNRVAALAGTTRSSGNLGISAALAVSEATIYGRGIDIRVSSFLHRTREATLNGASLEDCVREEIEKHRGLAGYGRPIASGDERIRPMMDLARRLGLDQGPHLKLAQAVEQFLLEGRWRWRMNYAALAAALTADLGLSPQEHYRFTFPAFLAGMQPCFIEAAERPAGTLLPLSCEQLSYSGPKPRAWSQRTDGAPVPGDQNR
jgi:hypothetical protein